MGAVPRVYEAVLERLADVLLAAAGLVLHQLPGEQSHLEAPLVLALPHEVLAPPLDHVDLVPGLYGQLSLWGRRREDWKLKREEEVGDR